MSASDELSMRSSESLTHAARANSSATTTMPGSVGRPLAWSLLIFLSGIVVTLFFLDVVVASRIPFNPSEWVAFNFAAILFTMYFAYLAAGASVPYTLTIEQAGVRVTDRSAVPGRPGRVRELVEWDDLKGADMVGFGLVAITTSPNVLNPFYLVPEQAKLVLLDARSPLKHRLSTDVAERLGITRS